MTDRAVTSTRPPLLPPPPRRSPLRGHSNLHDESSHTAPNRLRIPPAGVHARIFPKPPLPAIGARKLKISALNRPPHTYKEALRSPHLHNGLTPFPKPPSTTTPTTIAGRRPTPRSRLHKQSRPKVSTGLRSPRFPLCFPLSPAAADPWGAVAAVGRGCPGPPLFWIGREGGEKGVLPLPPALSPFSNRAPSSLFPLSLSSN
jgi:hypothetical protein